MVAQPPRHLAVKAFLLAPSAAVGLLFAAALLVGLVMLRSIFGAFWIAFLYALFGGVVIYAFTYGLALPGYIVLVLSHALSRRAVFAGAVVMAVLLPVVMAHGLPFGHLVLLMLLCVSNALTAAWVFCRVLQLEE